MIAATTRRIIAAAALLLSLSLSLIAQAQIAPGTGAGTRTFEAPPATRAPSRLDIAIPDASAMLQKLAGWVTRFRVSGSTVVSETELTDVLKPWTGRELSATDLSVALVCVNTGCMRLTLFPPSRRSLMVKYRSSFLRAAWARSNWT